MGSGELQTWNGHFDRGVYIDYTLEPLQSERHIEGTKDEASQSGSRIDEDTTIEIEDIEEENNSDQDESHRVDYMLAAAVESSLALLTHCGWGSLISIALANGEASVSMSL